MAEKTFPHMGNAGFPGTDNVNVYAYENTFDYTRWQPDVIVKCCNVLWDSNYSNVPNFESDTVRDTWFDALQGITETLQVETHILPDGRVKLPIPFDVMSQYNYLYCVFPVFTGADNPIRYEQTLNHRSRWYWFVKDVRSIAPNTTEVILDLDVWTTYENDCTISYMMLERGHYPMAQTSVSDYLSAPAANTQWLSSPDVNYGPDAKLVADQNSIVYNTDTTYAVFCCTGQIEADIDWGNFQYVDVPTNEDFWTVCATHYTNQGVPSVETFAVLASDLNDFLYDIDDKYPQFKQTVQCVFFASVNMISVGDSFQIFGHTAYQITSSCTTKTLLQLDKDNFGFGAYSNICKLYTYPYSRIRIATEDGPVAEIRIEDMTGNKLDAVSVLSFAWPTITLDCNILGVNGATSVLTFQNITERSFSMGGDWFDRLISWDIPTFGVVQSNRLAYDVGSYFDREQADLDRGVVKDNADASASANQENSKDAAQATYLSSSNDRYSTHATWIVDNAQMVNEWITAARSNATGVEQAAINSTKAFFTGATNNFIAMAAGGAQSITTGALTGGITGGIGGAVAGAATGAVQVPFSAITYSATMSTNNDYTAGVIDANRDRFAHVYGGSFSASTYDKDSTYSKTVYTQPTPATDDEGFISTASASASIEANHVANQQDINHSYKYRANQLRLANSHNAYNVVKGGTNYTIDTQSGESSEGDVTFTGTAVRSYNTATGNNTRVYNNEYSRIQNARRQGRAGAPQIYGTFNPQHATTRPIGLFAELVTQPMGAIACAGDQMLRYGYMLDRAVPATELSVMTYFTYWKASDLWVTGDRDKGVPEDAQERIKRAFLDGVTVWDNPSAIGNVSIYDNVVKER